MNLGESSPPRTGSLPVIKCACCCQFECWAPVELPFGFSLLLFALWARDWPKFRDQVLVSVFILWMLLFWARIWSNLVNFAQICPNLHRKHIQIMQISANAIPKSVRLPHYVARRRSFSSWRREAPFKELHCGHFASREKVSHAKGRKTSI